MTTFGGSLRQWTKSGLAALALAIGSGCETPPPAAPEVPRIAAAAADREALLALPTIHFAHQPPSPFVYKSGVEGLALLLGGLSSVGIQERMAREIVKDLRDPVPRAQQRFAARFSEQFGAGRVRSIDAPIAGDDTAALPALPDDAGLIEFKTMAWELHQAAKEGLGIGRSAYALRVRAVRARDRQVMWQDQCQLVDTDLKKLAEFRENRHALLQQRLDAAAERCADELFSRLAGR